MVDLKVAVTYSPEVGSLSAPSLIKSLSSVNFDVQVVDYRDMMRNIPNETFKEAYKTSKGRNKLFAHAKYIANQVLDQVDCLALSGNVLMIDPSLFNEPRDENFEYDFSRTIAELALIHVARQRGMPIMGICGGHEAIAVYHGSTIKSLTAAELANQGYISYDKIIFNTKSILGQVLSFQKKTSSSAPPSSSELKTLERNFFGAHKQVVDKLGEHLIKTATASDGNLMEAMEGEYGAPLIGIQFHPEITIYGIFPNSEYVGSREEIKDSFKLFDFLYKAAQTYSNKKRLEIEIKSVVSVSEPEKIALSKTNKSTLKVSGSFFANNLLNRDNQNEESLGAYKKPADRLLSAKFGQQNDTPSKILLSNQAMFFRENKRPHSALESTDSELSKLRHTEKKFN